MVADEKFPETTEGARQPANVDEEDHWDLDAIQKMEVEALKEREHRQQAASKYVSACSACT